MATHDFTATKASVDHLLTDVETALNRTPPDYMTAAAILGGIADTFHSAAESLVVSALKQASPLLGDLLQ